MSPESRSPPRLVPELDVSDLQRSREAYTVAFGFAVLFERPDERFVYLDLEGAQLMLQEASGPGRRFRTATLVPPFGRGINLQIQVADVDARYAATLAFGLTPLVALEERWYRQGERERGNRQFVVPDPDGYLLRFYTDLGSRPTTSPSNEPTKALRRA